MNCLKCGNVTNLMYSRGIGCSVIRYRRCPKCDTKMTTYEVPIEHLDEAKKYLDMD